MTNLKKNINKYLIIKFFDLISFLIFGGVLFTALVTFTVDLIKWGTVIAAFIGFAFFNKFLQKKYDAKEVPEMDEEETKKYNQATFFFLGFMFTLIGLLIKNLVSIQLYIFLAFIVLLATERNKSKLFKAKFVDAETFDDLKKPDIVAVIDEDKKETETVDLPIENVTVVEKEEKIPEQNPKLMDALIKNSVEVSDKEKMEPATEEDEKFAEKEELKLCECGCPRETHDEGQGLCQACEGGEKECKLFKEAEVEK